MIGQAVSMRLDQEETRSEETMRLGCCLNMLGDSRDPIGRAYITTAQQAGYDYVELPLAQVMDLGQTEFSELTTQLSASGIPCEVCNNFLPSNIKITGLDVRKEKVKDYLQVSIERAARLGAKIIVFGSSGAKNVPEGFCYDRAWEQIIDVLRWADSYTAAVGIRIAIEPLNKKESNIILNLTEAERLMHAAGVSSARLLVDYYHFTMEKEMLEILNERMPWIIHVHFAEPEGRCFPEQRKETYRKFFQTLWKGEYDGRVSVEAYASDPEQALRRAVFLKEYSA